MSLSLSSEWPRDGLHRVIPVPVERRLEPSAMPVPRTSFIGREREIGLVQALLGRDDVRLITLTGPGGVGKTRTAIRAASSFWGPTYFIDLADVQQPALVLPTIATALGVRPDGRPVLDNLRAVLRDDEMLLVLDNFEQVLAAAPMLADFLDTCPRIKLLVTSRALLGVPGERVVDVRPFSLPPRRQPEALEEAGNLDACRLFIDRAQALDPEFALTRANAASVVGICERLDGLPLAIELAAAWTSVLSPHALLAQLDDRLALPVAGSIATPQRQRSLRDTIAWSYGLLDAPAQALLRRLAVFHGGCSLDAITSVCGNGSLDVLQALRTLVSNSLVRRVDSSLDDSRYTLLETVRQFGIEALQESGEADPIRQRHTAFFLALAEQAEAVQNTLERERGLDRLEAEQGNLHSALERAIDQGDAEIALGLCGAMLPFWQFRFHPAVGLDFVRRALATGRDTPSLVVRKALYCAGNLAYMNEEDVESVAYFTDAFVRYLEAGDQAMTGRVEMALGRQAWDDDDLEAARRWFSSAKRRFVERGDNVGLAHCLHYEGLVAFKAGDYSLAKTCLHDALAMWQALGFSWELSQCIPGHLADIARAEGNFTDALTLYQECLRFNWERQNLEDVSWSLAGLALVSINDRQVERAVRLMALADWIEELMGAPLTTHIRRLHSLAAGMLLGRTDAERVIQMQRSVRQADLAAEIGAALALTRHESTADSPPLSGPGLTQRELEVLRMMASGKSNQDIADALYVSVGTVKVHVTRILDKIGVKSRAAATDYAHRHHLA